jgi:hypothetical protein
MNYSVGTLCKFEVRRQGADKETPKTQYKGIIKERVISKGKDKVVVYVIGHFPVEKCVTMSLKMCEARSELTSLESATLKIQSIWRMMVARKIAEEEDGDVSDELDSDSDDTVAEASDEDDGEEVFKWDLSVKEAAAKIEVKVKEEKDEKKVKKVKEVKEVKEDEEEEGWPEEMVLPKKDEEIPPTISDEDFEKLAADSDEEWVPKDPNKIVQGLFDLPPSVMSHLAMYVMGGEDNGKVIPARQVYLKSEDQHNGHLVIHKCVGYTKEQQRDLLMIQWARQFKWDLSVPFTQASWEEKYPDPDRRVKRGTIDFDIERQHRAITKFVPPKGWSHTATPNGDDHLRYNVLYRYYLKTDFDLPKKARRSIATVAYEQDKRMRDRHGRKAIHPEKEIICVLPKGKKVKTFDKVYVKYELLTKC